MPKTDLLGFIKARKSTLKFSEKPVRDSDLQKILEAGRWAPSPLNIQPWRFVVVREKAQAEKLMKTAFYGEVHGRPPLIIAIVIPRECWDPQSFSNACGGKVGVLESHASAAMAALNMVYEAQSLGIDSCTITPNQTDAAMILLARPKDVVPFFLGFGYEAKGAEKRKRERKPLSDTVSYETLSNRAKPG